MSADEGKSNPPYFRAVAIEQPAAMVGQRGDGEIRAAIDLGTNSFHLVIARRTGRHRVTVKVALYR